MNLDQVLSLLVLSYLAVASVIDYKRRETHAIPWLLILVAGISKFAYSVYVDKVPLSVLGYLLVLILAPTTIVVLLMKFQKFQLGDILAFISITLAVPISPFLLSPLTFTAFSVYLNSFLLYLIVTRIRKFNGKSHPYLPFLTFGFLIGLLGDPHIVFIINVLW